MNIDVNIVGCKNVNGEYTKESVKTLSCKVESLETIDIWIDNRLVSGIRVDKDGNVNHSAFAKVVGK